MFNEIPFSLWFQMCQGVFRVNATNIHGPVCMVDFIDLLFDAHVPNEYGLVHFRLISFRKYSILRNLSFFHLQSNGEIDTVEVLAILLFSSYAFGAVFIICELCQRMNNHYDDVDDMMGQLKWYLFPAKVQQILPMIIASVHEEVSVECFGSIACNRETFKRVNLILIGDYLFGSSNHKSFISVCRWFMADFHGSRYPVRLIFRTSTTFEVKIRIKWTTINRPVV